MNFAAANEMYDQATGLRQLFARHSAQTIAFSAATPLLGQGHFLAEAAFALAANRQRVLYVNENSAPQLAPEKLYVATARAPADLLQVIRGEITLEQAISRIEGSSLDMLCATRVAAADTAPSRRFTQHMQRLEANYDYVLIDCAAARTAHLSAVAEHAYHLVVAIDIASQGIMKAYAHIKRLTRTYHRTQVQIAVISQCSRDDARVAFNNLRQVAQDHLNVRLHYLGLAAPDNGAGLATIFDAALPRRPAGTESDAPHSRFLRA